jgi:hypothetical protein
MSDTDTLRNAINRVYACMKLRSCNDYDRYFEELAELVDDLGADFVCQHACEEAWSGGGEECAPGHCERSEQIEDDEYTCCRRDARSFIEYCLGRPAEN